MTLIRFLWVATNVVHGVASSSLLRKFTSLPSKHCPCWKGFCGWGLGNRRLWDSAGSTWTTKVLKTLPSSDSECAAEDWPGFSFLVLNFNLKLSVYGPEFLEEWKIMAISDSVFKKNKINQGFYFFISFWMFWMRLSPATHRRAEESYKPQKANAAKLLFVFF